MSGGSFGYLYIRFFDELRAVRDEVEGVVEEFSARQLPDCAARVRTEEILANLNRALELVDDDSLMEVWKAVEWTCSGDWGEESIFERALAYEAKT